MIARSTAHSKAESAQQHHYTIPFPQKENLVDSPTLPRYANYKGSLDLAISVVILAPLLVVMGIVASLILLFEGRPIFYRQARVGRGGKVFKIVKFRTMLPEAEAKTGPVWSQANDHRVTPLGRWLRKTHLDEIPQIFNVLAGEMSLVGPRPERPEFVAKLQREIPHYQRRHLVRPGVTGLAQLRRGYDSCLSDVASKTEVDLEYIATLSWWKDLGLLLQTLPTVIHHLRTDALPDQKAPSTVSVNFLDGFGERATPLTLFRIDEGEMEAQETVAAMLQEVHEATRVSKTPPRRAKTRIRRRSATMERQQVVENS